MKLYFSFLFRNDEQTLTLDSLYKKGKVQIQKDLSIERLIKSIKDIKIFFKSNLVTNTNKMQSIRLMTYHILSKDKSIEQL